MLRSKVPMYARLVRGVVALAVVAAGVMAASVLVATRPEPVRSDSGQELPRVQVVAAAKVQVARSWRGWGVADALVRADVPARVTATVEQVPAAVQAGQPVERDQLLVELDASDFVRDRDIARQRLAEVEALLAQLAVEKERLEERLAIERANLALTEAERQRVEQLFAGKVASQQDFDSVRRSELTARAALNLTTESYDRIAPRQAALEAQKQAQYASLQLAEQNVSRCRIVSPIDGVLQAVDVKAGENVAAGQRVARVVDLSRVEVPLQLPSASLGEVSVGDTVRLTPGSGADDGQRAWTATVTRVAPESDAQARTITVFAELAQPDARQRFARQGDAKLLLPGLFVEAVVTTQATSPRLVVPRRSVRSGRLFIVDDGVVQSRPARIDWVIEGKPAGLATGAGDDQWAVIDDVIGEGDAVVLSPGPSLLDGAKVAAVPISTGEVAAHSEAPAGPRTQETP